MEDYFNDEAYSVPMDSDCIEHDFDDYDLYGEIMEGDDCEDYNGDILFE